MDDEIRPQETKAEFQSSFKAWVRVMALILVVVFLPEQVAQAAQYDWRVIWQRPTTAVYQPNFLKDINNLDIPLAVKNILKDIAGKPITAIKISPTITLQLEKPLQFTAQRIEEIYDWLQGKPCGAKTLYDFLNLEGVSAQNRMWQ